MVGCRYYVQYAKRGIYEQKVTSELNLDTVKEL